MAEALNIQDTTYAGTFASQYWLPATFGMDTVNKGAVYVQDGIKKQHTIGRIDVSQTLQPRSATPVSQGKITIDGRVLVPQDVMAYLEFNPRDFEAHWEAEKLSKTLLAREVPPTVENFMMQIALNRSMEQIENGIHQGSLAYTRIVDPSDPKYPLQFFDGFIRKAIVDGTFLTVPSPAVLTASNIGTKFQAAYNLVTTGMLSRPDRYSRLKFFVSYADQLVYEDFLTTQTYKNNDTTEKGINRYKGYEIVALAGLPKDSFYLCEGIPDVQSNLYVGMNSTEDNTLQLARLQNNSELYFLKGLMKYDVQIGFMNQFIMHTTKVASDFL